MMQQSAGSQPNPQQQPQVTPGQEYLSNYIAQAIQKLKDERVPSSFQQIANGQVAQDLVAHKQDYI